MFREFQALKDELDATRNQLSERKAVEKAKGLLMQRKNISEDEAYQSLRKMGLHTILLKSINNISIHT
jgi:response regulator NasT